MAATLALCSCPPVPRCRATHTSRVVARASRASPPSVAAVAKVASTGVARKTLGPSDLSVSEVCYGLMTFGGQSSESEAHSLLGMAVERGVNFVDTAEVYPVPVSADRAGRSELILGTWLRNVPRDSIIVATKVAGRMKGNHVAGNRQDPVSLEPSDCCLDRANVRAACEASLRRLGTDYIDLYQIHWPDRYVPKFGSTVYRRDQEYPSVPIAETVAALGELIQEGKIRYYGVSNETSYGVCEYAHAARQLGVPAPISIQNSFSLLHRSFETDLAETCAPSHHNLALLPWSPLAGGVLSGKYRGGQQPAGARFTLFNGYQSRFFSPAVMHAVDQYCQLEADAGITPAQLALAFCRSREYVGSTIIGATNAAQLVEDLDAFCVELPADVLDAIDQIHLQMKDPSQLL